MRKDILLRLVRWLYFIVEYDCVISYRPGRMNGSADGLSKLAIEVEVGTNHNEEETLKSVIGPSKGTIGFDLAPQVILFHMKISVGDFIPVSEKVVES